MSREAAPRATPIDGGLGPTLVFGFGSHFAAALIGVLVVPIYLRQLGAEGYGLVGFYVVLQSWMLLFDMGVSPALARQLSRFRAGALPAAEAASLLRAAERLFLAGGLAAGLIFVLASGWVAHAWLGRSRLPPRELEHAVWLIGALLVFRWMTGLYQSALVGLERQNAVNAVALAGAVARAAAAVAALAWIAPSPFVFFSAQVALTLLEAAVSRVLLARAMPRAPAGGRGGWRLLANEFNFAAGLTISSAVATMISQADKLALSHVLPLSDFGVFSLVITICAGIAMVVPPFVQAFQPRLTTLMAQGRRAEFVHVYRLAAALIIALSAGLAGAIAAQPEMVLYGWTGSRDLASRLAPVLALYALGGGVASFLFVPFLLQYAQGQVRLHVIGNLMFGAVWIPAAVIAAFAFGPVGTGAVWLAGNLAYLVLWVPVIHRRLLAREERRGLAAGAWLRVAVLGALLAATRLIDPAALGRLATLATLATISATVMLVGALLSGELRATVARVIGLKPARA